MGKLWAFGDSFTDFYKPPVNSKVHWRQKYCEWKGYVPKVYVEFLAEKLNMDLINKGAGGCDNLSILEEFCKVCNRIQKDDVVIFGWTSPIRVRLADRYNKWGFFNPDVRNKNGFFSHKSLDSYDFLSEKTIQELIYNRDNILYILEINNWINLINHTLKDIHHFHWSWYTDLQNGNIFGAKQYRTIKNETNGEVDDGHWCEDGHKEFADLLAEKLFKNNPGMIKKLL